MTETTMLNLRKQEKEHSFTHESASALSLSPLDKTETAIIPLQQGSLAATDAQVEETEPTRLTRALDFLVRYPKLSVVFTACAVATLSLGTWVGALFFENKVLKHQINQRQQAAKVESAEEIKSRIDEAKTQMSQLQNQMEAQQTDVILTEQASLAGENARLLQDLNQLSKPQFGAPLVLLEAASVKFAANPANKDQATTIDVPFNYALFTVVMQPTPALTEKGFQSYFVELLNPKGKGVAWSEKLLKATTPSIPLTFARRAITAGKYQLKLYGLVGKKKEFVEQYDLQVNYLSDPALKPAKKAVKKK
ncbi:MAG: hypothetical protein HOP19_05035 [Acidobacteria bacterium]|nr:hypothetical protein [Acidobacteriota bacterium]